MARAPIQWIDTDDEPSARVVSTLHQRAPDVRVMVPVEYEAYARVATGWHRDNYQVDPLIQHLRSASPTISCNPDDCCFALADLYGWTGANPEVASGSVELTHEEEALKESDFSVFFNKLVADSTAGVRPKVGSAPVFPYRTADTDVRCYMLYRGPVEAATAIGDAGGPVAAADLWWPRDRLWFAGSDVDWPDTYVGGPSLFIQSLIADPELTAVAVDVFDDLDAEPLRVQP